MDREGVIDGVSDGEGHGVGNAGGGNLRIRRLLGHGCSASVVTADGRRGERPKWLGRDRDGGLPRGFRQIGRSGSYGGPSGDITQCAYGLDDSGEFGLITELTDYYSSQDSDYILNGAAVSDDGGKAVGQEWFDHEKQTSHRLSTIGNDGSHPLSLIRDTNTVVAVLEACAA